MQGNHIPLIAQRATKIPFSTESAVNGVLETQSGRASIFSCARYCLTSSLWLIGKEPLVRNEFSSLGTRTLTRTIEDEDEDAGDD